MGHVTLFGAAYSVYVRIARLVLEEAAAPYDLVEIDIFAKGSVPSDYWARHPFGKIPAFEHDGFHLFETDAIAAYVVDRFGAGGLMPQGPRERARVIQIMRIMDHYAYPRLVWGVFVEEVERDRAGQITAEAVDAARIVLRVLEDLTGDPFLVGEDLTLADLWAYPMLAYLRLAPTGRTLIAQCPRLKSWLAAMTTRPSIAATRFPRERAMGSAADGAA